MQISGELTATTTWPEAAPGVQTATMPAWQARFDAWQDAVRAPALSVLLVMQVIFIFFMGPLVSTGTLPRWLLEVSQMLLPLVSFFVLPRHSKVRVFILASALPIIALGMLDTGMLAGLLLRMLVTLAITLLVAQAVFQARTVTAHQLLGAVVVYLNLALLFMGVFAALAHAFPNAAFTTSSHAPLKGGELLYFSLTTLTSTGYGDLLPVHPLARSMANLEAVMGQLFLCTFLARVVTLHGKSLKSTATPAD